MSVRVGKHVLERVDVHTTTNNMIGGRKCTKLVLKPLAAKKGLSILVLCIAPFLWIII